MTKKRIEINTTKSRNEYALLKLLIEKYNLVETFNDKGDIGFYSIQAVQNNYDNLLNMKVNRIVGIRDLCSKSLTARIINFLYKTYPEDYDFMPQTFRLPQEKLQLKKFWETNIKTLMISKPSEASGGDGIKIFTNYDNLINSFNVTNSEEHVAQVYLANPLLIENRKFDLRLYCLIASLNPLIIYLNHDGLARFCTENYDLEKKFTTNDLYKHLTNYCLNKNSKNYVCGENEQQIDESSKRPFSSIWKYLEKNEGFNKLKLLKEIDEIAVKTVKAYLPFLNINSKIKQFQIIGLDIMIDDDYKPWLLEVNENPSLQINHEQQKEEDSVKFSFVDVIVKEQVVRDAIIIMMTKKSKLKEMGIGSDYNSYRLIEFDEDPEESDLGIFCEIKNLYCSLLGVRSKGMNMLNFEKLGKKSIITCDKVSLQLLFKRFCAGTKIDLFGFVRCLEELQQKCQPEMDFEDLVSQLN